MKGRLFLVHWNQEEAESHARKLRDSGWQVDVESEDGARAGKVIKDNPPTVVVIYLSHLPSHGRETAHALRAMKATKSVPIVFVDGNQEAIEKTKAKVPDAIYVSSNELDGVLDGLTS